MQEKILIALGQRIRQLRAARGYSQEAFADACGFHRTFIGTVERGESNISFLNLVRITAKLGLTMAEMLADLEKAAGIDAGEDR